MHRGGLPASTVAYVFCHSYRKISFTENTQNIIRNRILRAINIYSVDRMEAEDRKGGKEAKADGTLQFGSAVRSFNPIGGRILETDGRRMQ